MHNKIFIKLLLTVCLFISANCIAASWNNGKVLIVEMRPWSQDALLVKWTGPGTECPGSRNEMIVRAANVGGAAYYDRIYSGLLAASYSQQLVRAYVDGCDATHQVQVLKSIQFCGTDFCQ